MTEGKVTESETGGNPVRRVVSVAIHDEDDSGRILTVRRPPDDPDLPDAWGLPAGRIHAGEHALTAVRRTGRQKLGVELERIRSRRSGTLERPGYRLEMELFDAVLREGEPSVPQPVEAMTQYTEWRWARPAVLKPAAAQGSLCCRLFLAGPPDAAS